VKKKNRNEETVPYLDLAPRLKRPLKLWNPLDYLRLLYWVFFFPQAIRWYVEKFGKPEYRDARGYKVVKEVFRNDPIQRQLIVQGFFLSIFISLAICWGLSALGISINWFFVTFGVPLGAALGMVLGVTVCVALGVAGGVAGGAAGGVVGGAAGSVAGGAALVATFCVALGVAPGVALGAKEAVEGAGMFGALGVVGGVAFGVVVSAKLGVMGSVLMGASFGLLFILTFFITLYRFLDYTLLLLPGQFICDLSKKKYHWQASRIVLIPLPGLKKQLQKWLEIDWTAGLYNANQLLAYTLQFIPVVKAIDAALARSPAYSLLTRAAALADKPFDWNLVQFGSTNLYNRLRKEFYRGFFLFSLKKLRQHLRVRFTAEPPLDTLAHAACAGFWYWHKKEASKAAEAFAVVKELPHGPELYGIARAIVQAQEAVDLQTIAAWEQETLWLNNLPHPELRAGTLEVLRILRTIAGEARAAHHSQAPLNRSAAIGRAVADLTRLLETGATVCPEPEWTLIKVIVGKWRDIFSKAGGAVGEEVLRQPVLNPYEGYSGLPVTGSTFVGRADIMKKIENHWVTQGQPGTIILFGHRRMGKTSILRNLAERIGTDTLYVYLNMQDVGLVNHTGELFLEFAEAIHHAVTGAGLHAGPAPVEASYKNLGAGRRGLNALLNKLDPQMAGCKRLVLAIDEFELIETGITEDRIDAGVLPYLRSIAQKYRWLGLIFAGLHTLDEMGRDYQSAFYGQAEYIRVGYLDYNDAVQLITQPHPDFALEYAPDLLAELYSLTSGQPFLIQRLCWELVTRWNERFLKQGESTPRILACDDLAPVLTPDFFQGAGYYFEGVWNNVTDNERTLMRILAAREKGAWTLAELAAAVKEIPSFKESENLEKAVDLLKRHDVIAVEKGGIRIASELMRRWVHARDNREKPSKW